MLKFLTRAVRVYRSVRPAHGPARSRLRLEALEDRLALSWPGVPPSTIAPPANAVAVTLDAQGSASITRNETDFYTFVAPSSGSYRLSALTPGSNLDPVLGVFTASGSRIAYNDDISSSNRDSQLTVSLTAGNRYYFGITNYTGTRGGTYTWQVDSLSASPTDDSFEDNDSLAQAANLGMLTSRRTVNNLVMADAADWFRYTTTATGTTAHSVTVTFQNAQGNLDLELYNANGQRLRLSNGTGNSETVTLDGLAATTYYVRVIGFQGATNPSYTLDIVPPSASGPDPSPGSFDIVVRVSGLSASQQQVFERAAARWEQIITGDVPNATYQGVTVDDILIDAVARAIDGSGGVLGQAGPDALRSGSRLPIHGDMEFDSADLAALEASGQLYDVVLHEMGHVLGIGTIWQSLGLLAGAGTTNPRFLGTRATAEYNTLFGTSGTSVPVEGRPSPAGSRDGHWRESVFGNELMSPYINGSPNPLSRVTVASLADLGYTVNLSAADAYVPPRSLVGGSSATGGSGAALLLGGTPTSPAAWVDVATLVSLNRLASIVGDGQVPEALDVSRSEQGAAAVRPISAYTGEVIETFNNPAAKDRSALRPLRGSSLPVSSTTALIGRYSETPEWLAGSLEEVLF